MNWIYWIDIVVTSSVCACLLYIIFGGLIEDKLKKVMG